MHRLIPAICVTGAMCLASFPAQSQFIEFDVPDGWSANESRSSADDEMEWNVAPGSNAEVEREIAQKHGLVELLPLYDPKNSITSEEYRALEDPLASGLAFVRILIGPPPWMSPAGDIAPWRTADDIREYLEKNKKRVVPTPSDIGAMPGLRYVHHDTLMFEHIFAPDRRLFISVFPATTKHLDAIEAMIRTIRPIE